MSTRIPRKMARIVTAVFLLLLITFATTHAGSSPRGSRTAPAQAPDGVAITATKTDSLVNDVNKNTLVDPGDTLEYSIVVTNNGDQDALAATFTDITDDTELSIVAGSFRATPIGRDNAYDVIGNTQITHAAGTGFVANDLDPDGGVLTTSCAPCTTSQGASVSLNPDGSFSYTPPVGFTGTDTFVYTVTDPDGLTDTGTVTFTVSNRIWWVDSGAAAGDGRSTTPFNTLSAAQTASAANDVVFVYNREAIYTGGFAMDNGERLCGQGSDLQTCSGITPPAGSTFPVVTSNPILSSAAGAGITLAQNNTIQGVTVGSTAGFGISGTDFGTLAAQNITINTDNGGLSLTTGTANVTFTAVTSTGGTNNIYLTDVAGTLNLGSGALSGSSSHAFSVNGGTATISYSGTINNSTADTVLIQNKTAGSVTLSGAVTSTGAGITLTNNTGATIHLTGGLTISTGANEAFTATGGGTLNVTGAANTVTTTTGTAVNIRSMTIGASNVTFRSVSANGGSNGIFLDSNTGGTFTVSGTGAAGSGGTIQNMTGADGATGGIGIYLNNTGNVSLNWMQLNGFSNFAIRGLNASNFTLANSVVSGTNGNSAAADEGAVSFDNLTGTSAITNATISGGYEDNVRVVNNSGVLNVTVSGSTIRDTTAVSPGNNGLWFQADGTANITASVTTSSFLRNRANGIQAITTDSGVLDITVGANGAGGSGGTFQDNNIGVNIAHNSSGTLNFDVQNATFQAVALADGASPININLGALGNQMSGSVLNNVITNRNSSTGPGMRVIGNGAGTLTILISGNDVSQVGNRGIEIIARDGSNTINATITSNTVTLTDALSADGIRADAGVISTDTTTICANINGNTSTTIAGLNGIRVRQRFMGTTYRLVGYSGSATDDAAVIAFLSGRNNGAVTAAEHGGSGFQGVVSCPMPLVFSPQEPGAERFELVDQSLQETTWDIVLQEVIPASMVSVELVSQVTAVPSPQPRTVTKPVSTAVKPDYLLKGEQASDAAQVTSTIGPFTLPAGESTTITFRAVVKTPFLAANNPICNQATISGSNFSDVLTDDPDEPGSSNPTCTTVNINADLTVTKTDGSATEISGTAVTYTIVVSNAGPDLDPAAVVVDDFPAAVTGVTWTCAGAGGAACTDSGSGNISETVNLPAGGSTTFTATGTINPAAAGTLANTATVTTSTGITDPVPADNSATDTDTLTPQADVSITKTDGQASDVPGTSIVYTIIASNAGPSDAPSVTVADTFPASLSGISWTCVGAGGGACTASGSGSINDMVDLPAGGSVSYTVSASIAATAAGAVTNTATAVVAGGVTDPSTDNNSATDATTLTPEADVSISKTDGQGSDIPGTSIAYTITASNAGPSASPSVTIVDTFPAGLTGISWTCAGAGGTACTASGSGNINDAVNLPVGGSVIYTVNAAIDSSAEGTLSNTASATVGGGVTDPNAANNSATDTTTLTAEADLAVTKTDGQMTAVPGQSVTYTIAASNAGPSAASSAAVADTFPAFLTSITWTCVGAGGATCTAAGAGNIAETVNLPVGGSVVFTASGTISRSATGTLVNTATVTSSATDLNLANNSATDTDTLTPIADLSIIKTDGQVTAVPGQPITYTIVASNAGPSDVSGASIADTFPAALTGVSWTCVGAGGGTCTASGLGNINDTVNLPAGGTVTFTANGTLDAGAAGTLANTAVVTAPGGVTDPSTGNNSATDTDTLTAATDLSISKTDGLTIALPGQPITYTIAVSNAGPSTAVNATVVDTFPAELTGVTWTCTGSGGAACTAAGSGAIADTVTLPPGGSLTYVINATIDAGASAAMLANTATVSAPGGVTDPEPGNNSSTDNTSLDAPPEITDLAVTPDTIDENEPVNLSVTLADPNMPEPHDVMIDWGDGISETIDLAAGELVTSTEHLYLDDDPAGDPSDSYTITVTVNEPDGETDSDTAVVTVNNIAPSLSGISASDVNENGNTTLNGRITDPGTQDTFALLVDWGDGSSEMFNYVAGTAVFTETHTYLDDDPSGTLADVYSVSLTLTDDDTGSSGSSAMLTVFNEAPLVDAGVDVSAVVSTTITFSGRFTDTGTLDTHAVDWAFGDGGTAVGTLTPGHIYAAPGVYTATLTVTDDDTGLGSDQLVVTVADSHSYVYLPMILAGSGMPPGPDLVVSSLTASGSDVTVVVTNQGETAVTDAFWVDVYIDPDPVPTMVNQTWTIIADEGLVWGVSDVILNPGQSLTLTVNGTHYWPDLSDFSGNLLPGTPVYAQVDSANADTSYGNVLENHERGGGVYNNITGTTAQQTGIENGTRYLVRTDQRLADTLFGYKRERPLYRYYQKDPKGLVSLKWTTHKAKPLWAWIVTGR